VLGLGGARGSARGALRGGARGAPRVRVRPAPRYAGSSLRVAAGAAAGRPQGRPPAWLRAQAGGGPRGLGSVAWKTTRTGHPVATERVAASTATGHGLRALGARAAPPFAYCWVVPLAPWGCYGPRPSWGRLGPRADLPPSPRPPGRP
uniref:Shadow of prion protein n=1 Tax=Sus scrofa TaxID=9823 RepID=A0A4X1V4K8_PIG